MLAFLTAKSVLLVLNVGSGLLLFCIDQMNQVKLVQFLQCKNESTVNFVFSVVTIPITFFHSTLVLA